MMTRQQSPEGMRRNIASSALEMARILSGESTDGIGATLHSARSDELFCWWHEAMAHAMAAPTDSPWEKKMGEALASEIAKEAIRRLKPRD